MAPQWHNRISGYGEESPDTLLANPRNFRRHPKHQQDALAGVLRDVGVVQNVIVNRTTGLVVDGHARIALAIRDGQTTIPITYVELSEAEESLVLATLDPIAALATIDAAILENLLREVTTGDAAVQAMLDALAVDAGIVPGLGEPGDGGDDFDTTPADGPTRVQRGELWQLGNHRLLCGDSTNAEDVARLMGGERAALCFTSPPYNAGDSEKLTNNTHTNDTKYVVGGKDALSDERYLELLRQSTKTALDNSQYIIINVQSLAGNKVMLIEWLHMFRHHFADVAVWVKDTPQPAMARRVLTSQFEYLFFLSAEYMPNRAVGVADFRGTVSNVYHGASNRGHADFEIHAAQFPVHLPTWGIENFTRHSDVILDMFVGVGTTIIAAERTGRRCYGMEIEPRYADVCLKRWEAETGRSAEKVG